ncbi:MAG: gliding motility-associated C-terminal domain-containing protein [Saprospiraceae bacterium]|nr:gliding motility-associated C-terminal domain-containing protein [Saprospiraceae bacterium]
MRYNLLITLLIAFNSLYSTSIKKWNMGCGLIQVTIIIDNTCNGIYDNGDTYALDVSIRLQGPQNFNQSVETDQNGHSFFSNLESGNYTSHITVPQGFTVTNTQQSISLSPNEVGIINYFICKKCEPQFSIKQTQMKPGCCPVGMTMNVEGNYPILSATWSNGTNGIIAATTSSGNYSVTVKYNCNGTVQTTSVNSFVNLFKSGFPNLSYFPNAVRPSNPLIMIDNNVSMGALGGYNANEFALRIFDRWGNLVYEQKRKDCEGLINGEIRWDGKDLNGKVLKQDMYVAYLVLENCEYQCNNDNWSQNFINGILRRCKENITRFEVFWFP